MSVPNPPGEPQASNITQVSVRLDWNPPVPNGSGTIINYEISYGTESAMRSLSVTTAAAPTSKILNGLQPATIYYFAVRARNIEGWGAWSLEGNGRTQAGGPYVKFGLVWHETVPYVNVNGIWKVARAWGKVAGTWRETL